MNPSASLRYAITFALSLEVMADASRLFLGRTYRLVTVACLQIVGAGVLVAIAGANFTNLGGLVFVGGVLVAWGILLLGASQLRALDRWMLRRQAGGMLGQLTEIAFTDEALTFTTPVAESLIRWDQVTGVMESDRVVLFHRDRILLAYAPAPAFDTQEQRREILAFARDRIASAASIN